MFTVFDGVRTGGKIVETEAYDEDDPAAHCHVGARKIRFDGSKAMRLAGGHVYMYPARENWDKGQWCLNITTGKKDFGSAVLIRAIEPTHGLDIMRERRRAFAGAKALDDPISYKEHLSSGPGCVGNALQVAKIHDGLSVLADPFELYQRDSEPTIFFGPRVRVKSAQDLKRRFVDESSMYRSCRSLPIFPYPG